ncbi:MAG: AraC family transcriptional regulator [Clostridia bacterium]|nr:AraC family transcriptional regulator [Clostridia bacterium]
MLKLNDGNFFEYDIIGEFRSEGEWIHPDRIINTYELIFVLEGEVHLTEGTARYSLKPNEIIILEPGVRHFGFEKSTIPTAFYWFHFRTDLKIPCKLCKSGGYYDIKYLLKRLLHITNTPSYSAAAADAAGLSVLEELDFISKAASNAKRAVVNKIAEYIRINIRNNISAVKAAEHFGYNPDYIGKLFKESFKMGLKNYICAERVKLAKDLLLSTDLTVKQIAAELGFDSENLFIKFFKYHEEISPAKFRNRYGNTHMNNR